MSNEARVQSSLQIKKGSLTYQSQPQAFNATVTGTNGPTPGAVTVTTVGTNVSLAQLTAMGGLCRLMNLDATNYVEYGVWNGATFFPLGELLPGETFVLRLSRNLQYGASGTAVTDSLRFRANTASVIVLCEIFDP